VDEQAVEDFWNAHPCGDWQMGGLDENYRGDYERFFTDYDAFRYEYEAHIPDCLDRLDVSGKSVLEVGTGEGAEAEQLIRRGARYSAIDLTAEAVERTTTRLSLRNLPHERVVQASVLAIPFPDDSFDVVFSHGVLHHVPDIIAAQREIARVLKQEGELVAMLYARRSLNYLVSIGGIRRLALLAAYPARSRINSGILAGHLRNAEREGLGNYLRMKRFVHANTDGPDNPYAKVYDLRQVELDFPNFKIEERWRAFMHAPPLPVHKLPGGNVLGWHLWVRMRPMFTQTPWTQRADLPPQSTA
jgi:SAM-dependent methyltransferase